MAFSLDAGGRCESAFPGGGGPCFPFPIPCILFFQKTEIAYPRGGNHAETHGVRKNPRLCRRPRNNYTSRCGVCPPKLRPPPCLRGPREVAFSLTSAQEAPPEISHGHLGPCLRTGQRVAGHTAGLSEETQSPLPLGFVPSHSLPATAGRCPKARHLSGLFFNSGLRSLADLLEVFATQLKTLSSLLSTSLHELYTRHRSRRLANPDSFHLNYQKVGIITSFYRCGKPGTERLTCPKPRSQQQ